MDHRADIYSLGVVIYEMLTGELPLGRFPSPSQRAAVDARIDEIVLKTLEKEHDLRQQSATEVKTEMHLAMQPGQASVSTPATHAESRYFSAQSILSCLLTMIGLVIHSWGDMEIPAMIVIIIALVAGLPTWREYLGKFATITAGLFLFLIIVFLIRNGL